jgi:hypothetical protein
LLPAHSFHIEQCCDADNKEYEAEDSNEKVRIHDSQIDKPAEKNDGDDPPRLFPDRPKYTNQRVPICFMGHSGFLSREVLFVSLNPYR